MPIDVTDAAEIARLVLLHATDVARPFIVGIDGRSGTGKSTLAAELAPKLDATVIEGDDFYAGGTEVRSDDAASRAAACIDWTKQRCVLQTLASGRTAMWRAFDWDAFDGRLCVEPTGRESRPIIFLEGVYACRPELSDLLDLRVLLTVPDAVRRTRLLRREGTIRPWERQWHEAEVHYFTSVMPTNGFDVILSAAQE